MIKLKKLIKAKSDRFYAVTLVIAMLIIGTLGFYLTEDWTLKESLYATIVTVTTVGYGDFVPITESGRTFTLFFVLAAIGIAGYAISTLAAFLINREKTRMARKFQERKMNQIANLQDYIILCGGGLVGGQVARTFYREKTSFVIIEPDESVLRTTLLYLHDDYVTKKLQQVRGLDFSIDADSEYEAIDIATLAADLDILYWNEDATEDRTLLKAGVANARGLVTTFDDDKDNLFVALSARQLARRLDNADLFIVSRLSEEKNRSKLKAAGVDRIHSLDVAGGLQMAAAVLQPEVSSFLQHMIFEAGQLIRFTALSVPDSPDLEGQTVAAVREQGRKAVVAIKRDESYLYMPQPATLVQKNDILIAIGASDETV